MFSLATAAMHIDLFIDDGEQVAVAVAADLFDVSLFVFSITDLHSKILLF